MSTRSSCTRLWRAIREYCTMERWGTL